jgi:hypothetical protein
MPFPCRSPTMPRICRSESDLSRPRQVRGSVAPGERHGMCELASAAQRRHVGDLPAFGTHAEWQGSGRVVAWSRQGHGSWTAWESHICESALFQGCSNREVVVRQERWGAAGKERHGVVEVARHPPATQPRMQQNCQQNKYFKLKINMTGLKMRLNYRNIIIGIWKIFMMLLKVSVVARTRLQKPSLRHYVHCINIYTYIYYKCGYIYWYLCKSCPVTRHAAGEGSWVYIYTRSRPLN